MRRGLDRLLQSQTIADATVYRVSQFIWRDSSTFECFFPNMDSFASLYTTKIWMFNWFQGKMS